MNYDLKMPRYRSHVNYTVLSKVGCNLKILDIGCSTGLLGGYLKKKNNEVWGIDISRKAIIEAKKVLDKALCLDIEKNNTVVPRKYFDIVILGDILEHTKNPLDVLNRTKKYLKKEGTLIISVPNIAYWRIRLSLLSGRFDYTDKGILDDTHLRFFTKKSIFKLIKNADLHITGCNINIGGGKISRRGTITNFLKKRIPSLIAIQFIITARKNENTPN